MPPAVAGNRRTLLVLCVASAGWAFGFGLGGPLAALWLSAAGRGARTIGLNTSLYYLGVALAAPLVPRLMGRSGRTCVVVGMVIDALATALFPWGNGLTGWFLLRAAAGAGTALSLIPMETLVNRNARPGRRSRDFGLYALAVAGGIGLGSLLGLPLYPFAPRLTFVLGGAVTLAAAAFAAWGLPADLGWETEATVGPLPRIRANLLSFGTAWVQGFLEGGSITFLSLYLLALGYTEGGTGVLMCVLFLGVVLAQVPLAWLADRLDRLGVLFACHGLLLAGLVCLPFCTGPVVLAGWLFVVGACCGALYPLGLALLGERLAAADLAAANAWYLAINCAGSLSGPVLMGLAIDHLGQRALFAAGAVALVLVLALGTVRGQTPDRAGEWRSGSPKGARRMAG